MVLKLSLFFLVVIFGAEASPPLQRGHFGNYGFMPFQNRGQRYSYPQQHYPQQNYQQQQQQQQQRAPTVEIQQVTAEWVCNNYVTGDVKFFGVRDIVTTRLSSDDVEKLLKNGVPNTNDGKVNSDLNVNGNTVVVSPNNPFLPSNPPVQTEPPNTDGTGIIEARIG